IRKELMEQNKTGKYLKYAIGEIVLVVIGILIAISINTWNQNRLNAIVEHELLENLLSDIELDLKNLKTLDSISTLSVVSKKAILKFVKTGELSQDSVFYYISTLFPLNAFIPTAITYSEMQNSEGFKVIQSSELRRDIAILYGHYEKVENYEKRYYNAHTRLSNIRVENFTTASSSLIGQGDIRDPDLLIEQIRTNRKFINALENNYAVNRNRIYKESLGIVMKFKLKLNNYIIKND
ncbi:hypothetical protein JYT89_04245, partial [Flavobacteriaceae bacterium AH-315-B10]|nr:hypothetical protein [Flavobacteriaceae bacterium AH-315-B10]